MKCEGCHGVGKLFDSCTRAAYRCAICQGTGVLPDKPAPLGSASNPGTPIVGYVLAGRTLHTFEERETMRRFIEGTEGSGVAWMAATNVDRHVRWIGRAFASVNPDVPTPSDWDLMEAES